MPYTKKRLEKFAFKKEWWHENQPGVGGFWG